MRSWGNENVDWDGINDAAFYIAKYIAKWGRIGISQYKEKFGTVRVYCVFGFDSIFGFTHPYHHWVPTWWPYSVDLKISAMLSRMLHPILHIWQRFIYRRAYKNAIQKWPHLKEEILCCADFNEYLEGL